MDDHLPQFSGFTKEYQHALYKYLKQSLPKNIVQSNESKLRLAFNIAFDGHKQQMRKAQANTPYIVHPVEVAKIIANEMGQGIDSVLSAILHDVIEDTKYTYDYLEKKFGKKIAEIVNGVTKITKLGGKEKLTPEEKSKLKENEKIATYKRLIASFMVYPEVILVKIADRLHNMRTMNNMPEHKQKIKSEENLKIYAPFAEAIGLYDIKIEIEELSFKYIYPQAFKIYKKIINTKIKENEENFKELEQKIQKILTKETKINFSIKRVKKSLYSIFVKAENNLVHPEEGEIKKFIDQNIHNYQSLRIIADYDREKATDLLKIKEILKEKFDIQKVQNWITNPKLNGFRALIMDLIFENRKYEIQVLTAKDDIIAHKGYYESYSNIQKKFKEAESPEIILSRLKSLITPTQIYIFTPKGEKIALPKGSYILDFAFAIHTELGLHFFGAKVNNRTVGYQHRLKSGESVYIFTSENSHPKEDWKNYVKTEKARKKIIEYLKKQKKEKLESNLEIKKGKPLEIYKNSEYITAPCCNPVPGDKAIAIKTLKGQIIVHRKDCPVLNNVISKSPSDIIYTDVKWNFKKHIAIKHKTFIYLEGIDDKGLLKQIVQLISEVHSLNTRRICMHTIEGGFKGFLEIEVDNTENLDKIIYNMQNLSQHIINVERINNFDIKNFIE